MDLKDKIEQHDGEPSFSAYKSAKGEMTEEQFRRTVDYEPNDTELQQARECLSVAHGMIGLGNPTDEAVNIAAKVIGGMGDELPRGGDGSPHSDWVMMESAVYREK